MSSLWIGIASVALGAGASIYGANKQAKAVKDAAAANVTSTGDQNASAWTNYLMTRGISPTVPVVAGQMPTAGNFVAVNQKLPLWAGFTTTKGLDGKNTYALAMPPTGGVASPLADPVAPTAPSSGGGGLGGMSNTSKAIALIDPGMALISNKRGGSWYDPLKLF